MKRLLLGMAMVLAAGVGQSHAAPITWAQSVVEYVAGSGVATNRDNPASALLAPTAAAPAGHERFVSLGLDGANDAETAFGGWLIVDFGVMFQNAAVVVEQTNSCNNDASVGCVGHREAAKLFVSAAIPYAGGFNPANPGSGWVAVNTLVVNDLAQSPNGQTVAIAGGPWRYLAIADHTRGTFGTTGGSTDGFDVNAIGAYAVPEPTSMLLIGLGLVGVGSRLRRRA